MLEGSWILLPQLHHQLVVKSIFRPSQDPLSDSHSYYSSLLSAPSLNSLLQSEEIFILHLDHCNNHSKFVRIHGETISKLAPAIFLSLFKKIKVLVPLQHLYNNAKPSSAPRQITTSKPDTIPITSMLTFVQFKTFKVVRTYLEEYQRWSSA